MKSITDSPLLLKIEKALKDSQNTEIGIRISILKEPVEQEDKETGDIHLVKWLCWNLINKSGDDQTEPQLELIHPKINEEIISADLSKFFSDYHFVVDNEIYLEE